MTAITRAFHQRQQQANRHARRQPRNRSDRSRCPAATASVPGQRKEDHEHDQLQENRGELRVRGLERTRGDVAPARRSTASSSTCRTGGTSRRYCGNMARKWSSRMGQTTCSDRQQDRRHSQHQRGERQVLAQQDVAPATPRRARTRESRRGRSRTDCAINCTHAEEHEDHPADGDQRPDRLRNARDAIARACEPKMRLMISGVSSIIFASGDRSSERKPASAMAETGSDKPGRRASSSRSPASAPAGAMSPTAGAGRPFRLVDCPWYMSDRRAVRPPETGRSDQASCPAAPESTAGRFPPPRP